MISRFIEHQQVWFHHQQTGEMGTHNPAAAQGMGWFIEVILMKSQPTEDFFGFGFEVVTFHLRELLLCIQAILTVGVCVFT